MTISFSLQDKRDDNSLLNIYPQDKMKEIFEPDTLYPSIDLHNGDVLTYSYRNH